MAETRTPTLGPAARAILNNTQDSMRRRIAMQMNSLTPDMYKNFQDIVDKYPGMSKDLIMAMVSQGLTVNTPGIGKIVSADGIAQLKADTTKIDEIKSTIKQDKNAFSLVGDAFKNAIYDPFKGTTRALFATLRYPYDVATGTLRDISAGKGLTTSAFGESTMLGSLIADTFGGKPGVDTGSGFFVSPESRVGKAQAKAMSAYGKVYGQSFTIGRYLAKSVGTTPDQTAYKVMSGLVDATLNIAMDPSTYAGVGVVTKGVKGVTSLGRSTKVTDMVKKAEPFTQPKVAVKEVDDTIADLNRQRWGAIKDEQVRVDARVQQADRDLMALEAERAKVYSGTLENVLNAKEVSSKAVKNNPQAQATLSTENIARYITSHDKVQNGEIVQGIGRLGAESKNTGGFTEGKIVLDELPEAGKLSIGAHGLEEFFVTTATDKPLVVLDLASDISTLTGKARQAEQLRRTQFVDALRDATLDFDIPTSTRRVLEDVISTTDDDLKGLRGFAVGNEFTDAPGALRTLGDVFRVIADSKDSAAMALAYNTMTKIWQFDVVANVRSIYGEAGGFMLSPKGKFGLVQADISDAFSKIADPTNIGANVFNLFDKIQDIDSSILKTKSELDNARAEAAAFEGRVKELDIFRQVANQDLETARKVLSDPEYKGLSRIIELNSKLAEKDLLREWLNSQVGVTNYLGGNLASDFSKPLKWMLGKNFARIAEIVAKQPDELAIARFFGNKLDADTVRLLAKAQTPDEVYSVFLSLLNPALMDPMVFRSLAFRGASKLVANPAMRLVDSPDLKVIKVAEKIDRVFGRFFVRSTVLNLGDSTQTIREFENWVSSAKFKAFITKRGQEDFIDDTLRKLYKADSAAERGAIIEKSIVDLNKIIAAKLRLDKEETAELLKKLKLGSAERNINEQYSVIQRATGTEPTFLTVGGDIVPLGKAVGLDQMLKGQAFLPDSQAILKAVAKFETAKLRNRARATRLFTEELGDVWRTAQLAFRVSYILRNIGEMQMRQMFSGHASIFSHPLQFISFVMATSGKNGPLNKLAQKVGKWQYDALGNKFVTELSEGEFMDAVSGFQLQVNRGESVSDFQQSRKAEIFKNYKLVDINSPEYYEGLAFTLNRWATDEFYPAVARLMQLGDENAKQAYVKRLITEFDNPGNPIREMTFGAFENNPGVKQIFLKDPNKPPAKDNLSFENIFRYLFDETPENETYANRIKAVAGNGPASSIIMDIIIGEAKIATKSGEFITIKSPWLTGGVKTPAQLGILETKFKNTLAKHIGKEDMANSTVIVRESEYALMAGGKMLTNFVDKFFSIAARFEGKYNFGPEYVMSYWDNVAKYASLLSTEDLAKLRVNAAKSLAPIAKGMAGRAVTFRKPPALRIIEKELKQRKGQPVKPTGYTITDVNRVAAEEASKQVANLFYDATRQKQWAQALRLVFPFAQAHTNTIAKWGKLTFSNPVPIYRFAKAFDALTKQGSNTIYDVTGMTYDDDQGFFYKDPNTDDLKFKMPIVGSVLGAMAGKNISMRDAIQVTAPVQSLNLAFGQANPALPGLGPAMQVAFIQSGKVNEFGTAYDIARDIITPFGAMESISDVVFPAWLRKTFAYSMGDSTLVNRGVKDWASYLAASGDYGDDPLGNDATRNQLFSDAKRFSKAMGIWQALFQSISPATPQSEILLKIKNPDNKMKFMTGTMLYQYWNEIQDNNPGDYGAAVRQFAETFGRNNLMIAVSGTTSAVTGTEDAWTFLNNNPETADVFAKSTTDVVPYFFPGGAEFAIKYYNWQKKSGVRRPLTLDELEREAENMIYAMRKDQIAEDQIAGGYTQYWYINQVAQLDKEFGGKPPETVTTASANEKLDRIGKALETPAFRQSPIYDQIAEFYPVFKDFQDILNKVNVSNYASLKAKGGYPTMLRDQLVTMAERLMQENPSFARIYYGVFAGQLEE